MSRKKENFVVLNGEIFELNGFSDTVALTGSCYVLNDIYDHYKRPSQWKMAIWQQWCKWAEDIDDMPNSYAWIEITHHNSQTFTISGQICIDNVPYKVYITKAHNRAWRLNA